MSSINRLDFTDALTSLKFIFLNSLKKESSKAEKEKYIDITVDQVLSLNLEKNSITNKVFLNFEIKKNDLRTNINNKSKMSNYYDIQKKILLEIFNLLD